MTFFKTSAFALASAALLTACGGGGSDTPAPAENTVENPPVSEPASAETPAEPAAVDTSEMFAALPEPYKSADYNRGKRTFKLCQSCHTLNEGGQNLVGPNLYGVFGREIGAVEGFTYSKAVQDSDIVWTPEILADWLESPRNFLPGNKMSFAGVRKPEDRTAVIAFIMAETGYSGE
nr:cytochrome c family protein [Hyphomonas sp. Mor2]